MTMADGRMYYCHNITYESSWTLPKQADTISTGRPIIEPSKPIVPPQPPKTVVDTTIPKQPDTTISIGLLQLESQVATLLVSAPSASSPLQKQADQETLIAAVLQRLQENEKKLAKEDHAKKSAALDDLARQFDERLKLMEKERGKEATGIESELMRLQDEISRTKDAAMKQELEKRVSKLVAAQEQLMDEYEAR